MKRPRFVLPSALLAALLLATLVTAGCDASVDAFDPDDVVGPYSVFGYLDASVDTQFVRVEPLRDSLLVGTTGGPARARVTLENLDTGATVAWRDSLVPVGAGAEARNFYTTGFIEPEATYRFRAAPMRGAAGNAEATTATVTVPSDFPTPTFADTSSLSDGIAVLTVEGVERIGAVIARYRAIVCQPPPFGSSEEPACGTRQFEASHLQDTTRVAGGAYRVRINWRQDLGEIVDYENEFVDVLLSARVTVASVSADWPDFDGLSVVEQRQAPQPPPDVGTNIEQGTGYLGGAITKTVPIPIDLSALENN